MPSRRQIFWRVCAISRQSASLSITQGPAINVNLFGFFNGAQGSAVLTPVFVSPTLAIVKRGRPPGTAAGGGKGKAWLREARASSSGSPQITPPFGRLLRPLGIVSRRCRIVQDELPGFPILHGQLLRLHIGFVPQFEPVLTASIGLHNLILHHLKQYRSRPVGIFTKTLLSGCSPRDIALQRVIVR